MNLKAIFRKNKSKRYHTADIMFRAGKILLMEQLYLKPNLRCSNLAKAIGTNRTYLWEALGERGLGFQDYLSKFRVRHFILNADTYIGKQRAEIAELCGFNDAKQLDKYLKKMFGTSLTEYMRLLADKAT